HLSSRIILVPHRCPDGGERLLGLLATQVADIREVQNEGPTTSLTADGRADRGPVVPDGLGALRLLALDRLLPDCAWRHLLALPGEARGWASPGSSVCSNGESAWTPRPWGRAPSLLPSATACAPLLSLIPSPTRAGSPILPRSSTPWSIGWSCRKRGFSGA